MIDFEYFYLIGINFIKLSLLNVKQLFTLVSLYILVLYTLRNM